MINGNSILGIIPARGGSKGLPRKNIQEVAGKPLIAWTIEESKKSKYIDKLILSSEDKEIIDVAKAWGCKVPFVRPVELAKDENGYQTCWTEPFIVTAPVNYHDCSQSSQSQQVTLQQILLRGLPTSN